MSVIDPNSFDLWGGSDGYSLRKSREKLDDLKNPTSMGTTSIERPGNYNSRHNTSIWDLKDAHIDIRGELMDQMRQSIDAQMLDTLKAELNRRPHIETDEEKVIKLLKGDFEKKTGLTFEKFIEVYNEILENNPEKLI